MDRNERREFIKAAAIEAMVGLLTKTENAYHPELNDVCSTATVYAVQLSKEVESALNAENLG